MMHSLTSLIKWIGFLVIPLGAVMFIKEYLWLKKPDCGRGDEHGRLHRRHDPGGVYLLTSLALVASVIRLANRRTLVHDMGCIETLARRYALRRQDRHNHRAENDRRRRRSPYSRSATLPTISA